jgi:predicted enzyme related to lactoylglutathione lyase
MSPRGTPQEVSVNQGIKTIIYPVRDPARAKLIFSRFLGTEPYVDGTYYVGFRVGDQEIGLDPHGHNAGMTGPVCYRDVDDIRESLQSLLDAGAQIQREVSDVGGRKLIASVRDVDGNILGLIQSP